MQKHKGFEIEKETMQSEGDNSELELTLMNTADASITSITVTLNGITVNPAWNSQFPLQPNSTISALYNLQLLPLGSIQLSLGNVFQLTVTAYFADGTSMTQTTNVILTGL